MGASELSVAPAGKGGQSFLFCSRAACRWRREADRRVIDEVAPLAARLLQDLGGADHDDRVLPIGTLRGLLPSSDGDDIALAEVAPLDRFQHRCRILAVAQSCRELRDRGLSVRLLALARPDGGRVVLV